MKCKRSSNERKLRNPACTRACQEWRWRVIWCKASIVTHPIAVGLRVAALVVVTMRVLVARWMPDTMYSKRMQASELLKRVRNCAMPGCEPECSGTWLRQEGEMRLAPGAGWLPFQAEQWLPGSAIEFRWKARFRFAKMIPVHVVDSFENGAGFLAARILGLIPLARSQGLATDAAEAMRGLAELPWRPFAFREAPWFSWEAVGTNKLLAAFNDGKTRTQVQFEIDDEGHVLGGRAFNRPRMVGNRLLESPWSGKFGAYRMFEGVNVPATAEASWDLAEGPYSYWRGRVVEFRVLR
jgi:hypothetical protein